MAWEEVDYDPFSESSGGWEPVDYDPFQKDEGLWEGFVKPTLKAIPKVVGTAAAGLASMPIAGLTGLAVGSLAALEGRDAFAEANQAMESVSGRGNLVDTPEEQAGLENVMLAMKPFQMAGEGWRQIGEATGIPYAEPVLGTIGETAAMLGLPAGVGKGVRNVKSQIRSLEAMRPGEDVIPTVPVERFPMGSDAPYSKFNPELAEEQLRIRERLSLPEGQGFEIVGERPRGFELTERTPTIEAPYDRASEIQALEAERVLKENKGGLGIPPEEPTIEPSPEYSTFLKEKKQWDELHDDSTLHSFPIPESPGPYSKYSPVLAEAINKTKERLGLTEGKGLELPPESAGMIQPLERPEMDLGVPKETPVEPVAKQTFENKQFDQIVNEFDRNGDLKNATWEKVTAPIESLRDNNKSLFDGKWNLGTEGSKTKGEIILDNEGKIIDGNHRTFEALKRGDTEITIVRPKAEQTESGGTPSGVATRIEAKAIERGLTDTGFDSLAEYDPTTLKAQAKKASDLINGDFEKTRRIIRGEEPIPEGVNAGPIVIAMEEHLKGIKDPKVAYDLAYELANSPLDTKISKAGQELSMNRGREADSFTSRIAEVKKAREAQAGPDITKRTEVVKKLKDETSKVHLPPEELSWNKFLNSIKC